MKYKIGDKVKLRKDLEVNKSYGHINFLKTMKCCLNKELTIERINYDRNTFTCEESIYIFSIEMIRDYTWEDFLKCPIGTKVTFENGVIMTRILETSDIDCFCGLREDGYCFRRNLEDLKTFKDNINALGKIIKIEEPTYTTLYESTNEVEEVKEMTIADLEKELGYKIKVVKEK